MDYYTTVQAVLKIAAIVLYVLVLASDVLPAFLKGGLRTVLSYVSVGLHIVLMPLILFGGFCSRQCTIGHNSLHIMRLPNMQNEN